MAKEDGDLSCSFHASHYPLTDGLFVSALQSGASFGRLFRRTMFPIRAVSHSSDDGYGDCPL